MGKNGKIRVMGEFTVDELLWALSDIDQSELRQFIKDLDAQVADYKFTKSLRDYFIKEIKKEDAATHNSKENP
jgi:hypothetical protein